MPFPPDVEGVINRIAELGMSSILDLEEGIALYDQILELAPVNSGKKVRIG
jgi:hypothetical protein